MGPANRSSNSELPSRPKFSWDAKSVHWTDGIGNKQRYAEAVHQWSTYHDLLPPTNSNHLPKNVRGIILQSQLYWRARDLARSIDEQLLHGADGAMHVVNAINKHDTLSVLSTVFSDFNQLIAARRADNESHKNFENCFAALVSKLNAHGDALAFPEPIISLLLLNSASVADSQRISILASVAHDIVKTEDDKKMIKSNSAAISKVSYESVASILRQCERDRTRSPQSSFFSLGAHSGLFTPRGGRGGERGGGRGGGRGGHRLTADELKQMKLRKACHTCKANGLTRYGHWSDDHNPNGLLSPVVPSLEHSHPATASSVTAPSSSNAADQQLQVVDPKTNRPKVALGFTSTLSTSTTLSAATVEHGESDHFLTVGPLVDDGAPFRAIGQVELDMVKEKLIFTSPPCEDKPDELNHFDLWQYGSGDHVSSAKANISSVELFARTDLNQIVSIRHLLIEGSSAWVVGRNITRRCSLEHIEFNGLLLPNTSPPDKITMIDHGFHSYIPISRFCAARDDALSPPVHAVSNAASKLSVASFDFPRIRRIVDRVHKHVCGHATFSYMRTLLLRNKLWNEQVQAYLVSVVENCAHCRASSTPPPNRRVSLSSLDCEFNQVVCIDHFFLDDTIMFHMMDTSTQYSAAHAVPSTDMANDIYALECLWLSQLWPPDAIHADGAFQNTEFSAFLQR